MPCGTMHSKSVPSSLSSHLGDEKGICNGDRPVHQRRWSSLVRTPAFQGGRGKLAIAGSNPAHGRTASGSRTNAVSRYSTMRKPSKHAARERIDRLVNVALEMSSQDVERSEAALTTALKILRRYNVRDVSLFKRYFYCHGCKRVIVPGRTATVRVSRGKVKSLSVTCLKCGYAYRIPLIKKDNGKKDNARCRTT